MDYGLLNRSTILAHANFISETDMELIKKEGAGIAHCPLSNFFFSDAVFPLRRALEKGLRVGLGTDIAGGPSVSIFDVGKTAIVSARALENGVNPDTSRDERGCSDSRIDFADAFYLATKGGADVLNILAGSFEKENYFDALLIDTEIDNAKISIQDGVDQDEDIIQKMVMLATRSNILKTWVGGLSV
jgi:guanine deaminase